MDKSLVEKTIKECQMVGRKYESGSAFVFDLYLAKPDAEAREVALYVLLEHRFEVMAPLLAGFMQEGLIP